jgi:hypothetical protein
MKVLMVILPDGDIQEPFIHTDNLTDKEKEEAFKLLDKELHDTTYGELDEMVSSLSGLVEDLKDELEQYKEIFEESESRKRIVGW